MTGQAKYICATRALHELYMYEMGITVQTDYSRKRGKNRMKITVLTVGKIKEKYLRDAIAGIYEETEPLLQAGDH